MTDYVYTTENFIKKSIEINGKDKYNYSKTECKNSRSRVILTCLKHNFEFEQIASNHIQGAQCKKCGIERRSKTQSNDIKKLIEKWNEIHNNKYCYDKVIYKNSYTKIEIVCPTHLSFWQIPSNHTSHAGCAKCASFESANNRRKPLNIFIEESNKKHNNKYDYSKVEYKKDKIKVCIICPIKDHGEFWQTSLAHIGHGYGCPKCARKFCGEQITYTTEIFIDKMKKKHSDKPYCYSKVKYITSITPIIVICKKHNIEFTTIPSYLLANGNGCSKCTHTIYSKIQIQWLKYLSVHQNIQHAKNGGEFRIPKTRYAADGYNKETNTIFEFNGSFYHGDSRYYYHKNINPVTKTTFGHLLKKTIKKELKLRNLGYNYKSIWDMDWIRGVEAVKKLQQIWKNKKKLQ
jgi:hypothetical protein